MNEVDALVGSRGAGSVDLAGDGHTGTALRMISESRRAAPSGLVRTRGFWSGPATPITVGQARRAVAGFATAGGLSELRVSDIQTCVSEAATNAVLHAFRDDRREGTITVAAELTRDALTVIVADDGIGFLPRDDSPGIGLGLPTIAALSSAMTVVTRARGGTEVSIAFNFDDPRGS